MSKFVVQTASAKMPSSCKGRYSRVAVLELADGYERAAMISERAKGVVRICATWEKRSMGKTERCAYRVALREANALAAELTWQHSG